MTDNRLCDVFEMLVNRLSAQEEKTEALDTFVRKRARHMDSLVPNGQRFSGLSFCGRCINIVAHDVLDSEGCFVHSKPEDMIVIYSNELPYCNYDIWADGKPSKWDDDLKSAWGLEKFESVHTLYEEGSKVFFQKNAVIARISAASGSKMKFSPTCQELGIDSAHSCAKIAIVEIALRHRHPSVLAIGDGIAITNTDIDGVVALIDLIMGDLGLDPLHEVALYLVSGLTASLGTAVVIGSDVQIQAAWSALSITSRRDLLREQHNILAFFTENILSDCQDPDF